MSETFTPKQITDAEMLDTVYAICREELSKVLPEIRQAVKNRIETELPGVRVEVAASHSGRDVYCSSFGNTNDAGVLGSLLKGCCREKLGEIAAKHITEPEMRALVAAALIDIRWDIKPSSR